MRIESSVTSLSWIPSEAVQGMTQAALRDGDGPLRRPRRPTSSTTSRPLRGGRPVPLRQPAAGVDRGRGRAGSSDWGHAGRRATSARPPCAWAPRRSSSRPWPSPTCSPSRRCRRPRCGSCRPPAGAPACRRPARSAGRRSCRSRPRWPGRPSPSPSGPTASSDWEVAGASPFPRHWIYDHDGALAAKTGMIDFKRLVPHRLRPPHAVGRRGLARPGDGGGDGPRAGAVGQDHAGRDQARDPDRRRRPRPWSSRATRATRLFLLLDGVLTWRSTARSWPRWAPAPSSGSGRCWRAGRGRPRCGR